MLEIELCCATHRTWKACLLFAEADFEHDFRGVTRSDVIRVALDSMVTQARHRLDSCVCASPLFDL